MPIIQSFISKITFLPIIIKRHNDIKIKTGYADNLIRTVGDGIFA